MEHAAGLRQAAAAKGIPLELVPVAGRVFRKLYGADLALVRPDQHVAWRGEHLPGNEAALLDRARGQAL
jgi:hypothetical protein